MADFTLPELGENVTAGTVANVLVNVGDTIAPDQSVIEIETDKATVEVPSSVAGVVKDIKVKKGDKVNVGSLVLTVESSSADLSADLSPEARSAKGEAGTAKADARSAKGEAQRATAEAERVDAAASGGQQQNVGATRPSATDKAGTIDPDLSADLSAEAGTAKVEARSAKAEQEGIVTSTPGKVVSMPRSARQAADPPLQAIDVVPFGAGSAERASAPASPMVRRMAREIGVNVDDVQGTGPVGRISQDDVKEHARRILTSVGTGRVSPGGSRPLPDFSKWGEIERQPMSSIRRATAEHLSQAWRTIPHVTQTEKADITSLEALRKQFAPQVEEQGGKLTMTAILVKVLAAAIRQFPQFNASVDMDAEEIVYKRYVNVGVAVDTDRGLLVPVIRDVDRKSLTQLAIEIQTAAQKARDKKLTLDEMSGGGISVSNLGSIGGTFFTPIVNWPEVAILGVSRGVMEPVYQKDGSFAPRLMLPLSLSYDHRLIDGADGIRFLRWVVNALEQPFLLAL